MKKVLCVILSVIFICISFTGCSGVNAELTEENVTKTVAVATKALQNFDVEDLEKYVSSQTLSVILTYGKEHQQFIDLGKTIFENLSIEVKSIDLENKTVTVSVINKDLAETANDFASSLKESNSTFQLMTKLNSESFLDTELNKLTKLINEDEMMSEPVEVTLGIEQGKKNLILKFDNNSEDAVSGGALSAIKNIYS